MSMKRATSQCAHWWQRWFCKIDFESGMWPNGHRTTCKFQERHEFVTPVYRIIRQNLKFKCLKKRCAQELIVANCALHRTRARKLLRRFPASAVDFIIFTDENIFIAVPEWRVYVPTMKKETRIELLTLVSDFAALCLCQPGEFSAWVTIKYQHQYKIWNACFVANFPCYNIAKYF